MIQLIKKTFPEDPNGAVAIAKCESGLKPTAHNPTNTNGTVDSGLFQINSTHFPRMERMGLDVWNPEHNVQFARMLYDESGWRPWVCAWKHLALASR